MDVYVIDSHIVMKYKYAWFPPFRNDYEDFVRDFSKQISQNLPSRVDSYMATTIKVFILTNISSREIVASGNKFLPGNNTSLGIWPSPAISHWTIFDHTIICILILFLGFTFFAFVSLPLPWALISLFLCCILIYILELLAAELVLCFCQYNFMVLFWNASCILI